MSDDILIGEKPLSTLRVVDLRDELKKRGIRSSGSKGQLQQLLLTAIASEKQNEEQNDSKSSNNHNQDINFSISKTENSPAKDTVKDKLNREKVASISINEEKETIKLTIRSSPRKLELVKKQQSESESTDASSSDSENVNLIENHGDEKQTVDSQNDFQSISQPAKNETFDLKKVSEIEKNIIQESAETVVEEKTNKVESNLKSDDVNKIDKKNEKTTNQSNRSGSKNSQVTNVEENSVTKTDKITEDKTTMIISKSTKESSVQKKRRWASDSKAENNSVLKKGISSDKLKQLINDSVLTENVQKISAKVSSKAINEDEASNFKVIEQKTESNVVKEEVKKVDILFKSSGLSKELSTSSKETNDTTALSNAETENVRSVSPAKNQVSTVLFITGLVRPYTLPQLKKLLSSTGTIDEEKFWIDKIKSKCYATYLTVEEAIKTREALHNLKWPQSSPKNLSVEFATLEDIDRCLNPENYKDLPMKKANIDRTFKNNVNQDAVISKENFDIHQDAKNDMHKVEDNVPKQNRVREWDREKIDRKTQNNEENRDFRQKKSRLSLSPLSYNDKRENSNEVNKEKIQQQFEEKQVTRSESPAKLLEDLFRKTKSMPFIYWLPLNEQQANDKEKQRNQTKKERESRMPPPLQPRNEISGTRRSPYATKRDKSPLGYKRRSPTMLLSRRRSPPLNSPIRRRSPPLASPIRRRPPSFSPVPLRRTRYSRSRSPDRRRFSPRRRH